jgi:4-diphosphocytidyl-2-C-methyl-D-erythritol kinase
MDVWPAPAKLNLFLHVVGRRADGYHLLQTAFQFLDYSDQLRFEITPDGRISRAHAVADVEEGADLCLRAARLLQVHSGTSRGAVISLTKQIPVGGGLGGGSSDAATTLIALNQLWGLGLSRVALADLGLQLGADVPVFVHGRAAWAEGVGDVLTPIDFEEPWYVVLSPPVQVSTREVFQDPDLTRQTPTITIRAFRAGQGANDLEAVVRRRYPEVDRTIRWLSQYGPARMTGSGACVFVAVTSRAAGEQILERAPCTGFVARGLNRHPLYIR